MLTLSRRQTLAGAALLSVAGLSGACARQSGRPAIGAHGLDLSGRDASIRPGDDFFGYANGNWVRNTTIPEDRVAWGTFDMLIEKAERDVHAIIEDAVRARGEEGSNRRKIADFYSAYIDTDTIEAAGLDPIRHSLDRIAAATTHEDIVRLMGAPDLPVASPIALGVTLDERNPDRYVVGLSHSGLSLPDRDYYLRDDAEMRQLRAAFQGHIARLLALGGTADPERKAAAILALETEIAHAHWPIAQRRQRELTYNLRTRAEIRALDPAFPWDAYFDSAELNEAEDAVVSELSAMGPLARLLRTTPVETWRAYLTYHLLSNRASVLPAALDRENFAFYGSTLSGQPTQLDRWRRGVNAANAVLGDAVGQLYVERHFPPSARAQMNALVENMRRAYAERIDALAWMSEATKIVAREKLAAFQSKIGYPDTWRDYSDLEIRAGDAFGNATRASVYAWRYDVARLRRPTDKNEWLYMHPQEVNAYYNPVFNEIVFPAGILQPPFFDPHADPAVNYGAIGGVIGHEMGHGFDDQGAKSDADGVLRDWWNADDVAAFGVLTRALAEQYSRFEALPNLRVNGELTLGENIGDNGGLQVALYAYRLSLNGNAAPELEGLTGEQRFFMSWAQAWREKMREETLRNMVISNEHAPARFRVNGVVRNMDDWYSAFDVRAGEDLYLPESERIEIW